MSKMISVLIPVYNEEENIRAAYEAVKKVADNQSHYNWEILFLDNRSEDKSFDLIKSLASQDDRVRGFSWSKNFGYQRSIYMGYLKSRGDAIMQIDCD